MIMFTVNIKGAHHGNGNSSLFLVDDRFLFEDPFCPSVAPVDMLRFAIKGIGVAHRSWPIIGVDTRGADDEGMFRLERGNRIEGMGIDEIVESEHLEIIFLAKSDPVSARGQMKNIVCPLEGLNCEGGILKASFAVFHFRLKIRDIFPRALGFIIDDNDLSPLVDELPSEKASDKTKASCDSDFFLEIKGVSHVADGRGIKQIKQSEEYYGVLPISNGIKKSLRKAGKQETLYFL